MSEGRSSQSRTERRLTRLSRQHVRTTPEDVAWLVVAGFGATTIAAAPVQVVMRFLEARSDLWALSGSFIQFVLWLMLGLYLAVLFVLIAGAGWFIMMGAWHRTRWGFSAAVAHSVASQVEESSPVAPNTLRWFRRALAAMLIAIACVAIALAYQLAQP
jgi:hypothetical protein